MMQKKYGFDCYRMINKLWVKEAAHYSITLLIILFAFEFRIVNC